MPVERKDRITFRLLDLESSFYDYIDDNENLTPSDAVRHFIKNGFLKDGGLSVEEKKMFRISLIELKRAQQSVGINLNQMTRYFNQTDKVNESNLSNTHQVLLENQMEISDLLNKIFAKI